jgi:hypothetical protein
MSEWLRRQIQDLLRKLMGSNPISCNPAVKTETW